ncbi:MAG TPA: HAD family hydrolase [Rickettsiales bacterium]|nr:HAD family hydrolase [Rickettsiales bacterium]
MKTLQKPQVIIFDWDNTLAENRDVVVSSMNKVLAKYGKEEWEVAKKKYRDPNKSLKENFVNFFGENAKKAYEEYLQAYLELYKELLQPLPFSQEALRYLNKNNPEVKLIIVSNKERSLLLLEIEALYKDINFFKIMANGDSEKNKPDASPVFKALEGTEIEINPLNVWIIGDSKQDIDCAYNAGCQPILYGEGKLAEAEYFEEKKKASPSMKNIRSFEEIIECFVHNF